MSSPLTGMLPAILIISAVLTAVISAFLLRLYKKATIKGMSKTSGAKIDESKGKPSIRRGPELQIQTYSVEEAQEHTVESLLTDAKKSIRFLMVIYAVGGMAYAIFMTMAFMVMMSDGFYPGRFIWLLTCYLWPTILAVLLVKAPAGSEIWRIILIYMMALIAVAVVTVAINSEVTLGELTFFWMYINAPATLLLMAFLRKRVRAVGPIVLAFTVFGVGGAFMFVEITGQSDAMLRIAAQIGAAIGLGAFAIFIILLLVGFIILGLVGWSILRILGARYQRKRFSDQSLTIDSLWLTFGVVQSINLAFEGTLWVFTGLVAFAVYKAVVVFGLRLRPAEQASAPSLLLLRVFALARRSEKFFDRFSQWWRYSGSISMIAGPDLITSSVEPHEFLEFVGGRLSRQFVQDRNDLKSRVSQLDVRPDPDGRFRTNEFFCRDDNWKITMQALSKHSDVVIMDLRSFSSQNQGCLYELEQLLNLVNLSRVIFLVDQTTDLPFLNKSLVSLWSNIDQDSPNLQENEPRALTFHLEDSADSTKALIAILSRKLVA